MTMMIKKQGGFTLVELLIAMAVFVISLVLISNFFVGQLTLFKQQSKIAETNIEGIIGLEIMRRDVENAGYGLPWAYQSAIDCSGDVCGEAKGAASAYNDFPANAPRAVVMDKGAGVNGSDYLVIKAVDVGISGTSQKWTRLSMTPPATNSAPGNPRIWSRSDDQFSGTERVTVLSLNGTSSNRQLIVDAGSFSTQYSNVNSAPWPPSDQTETRVVYGVDPTTVLRMPFNRADYFISTSNTPSRCAPGTGVLEKAVVSQADSSLAAGSYLPLLDCVADMKVIFGLDLGSPSGSDPNGVIDTYTDGNTLVSWNGDYAASLADVQNVLGTATTSEGAANVRQSVKEIRIYVLTHEGQRDTSFSYSNPDGGGSTVLVGDKDIGVSLGDNFDLALKIGNPEYKYYRWKLYTIVVKPNNL
jgi:prepilin-type N-terminal cleavage/methylation domain-containing protein